MLPPWALNRAAHVSLSLCSQRFGGIYPKVELLGHSYSVFNFLRNCSTTLLFPCLDYVNFSHGRLHFLSTHGRQHSPSEDGTGSPSREQSLAQNELSTVAEGTDVRTNGRTEAARSLPFVALTACGMNTFLIGGHYDPNSARYRHA